MSALAGRLAEVREQRLAWWLARVVTAMCLGYAAANVVSALQNWTFQDFDAYWLAAERLKSGDTLYLHYANPDDARFYRYAPWFAFAWIPLTELPRRMVELGWGVTLAACSAVAVLPLARVRSRAAVCAAALMGAILFWAAAWGNAHPLLVALLVYLLPTRAGPLAIAVAASLKAFPILFVAVYLKRRQWRAALVAGVGTVALVAPMLLFDLSGYPTDPGRALLVGPLWVHVAGAAVALAVLLRAERRLDWFWAAIAVMAAYPKFHIYDATYALADGDGHAAAG